jgi:hypothetical protein
MIRRFVPVLATIILGAAVALAATVEDLGFDPLHVQDAFDTSLRGYWVAPEVPAALRALPDDQKVAAVRTLGAFVRAYAESPEYRKRYDKARKAQSGGGRFGLPSLDVKAIAKGALDKAARGDDPSRLEKDASAQVRKRLQQFLDDTAEVDFTARTEGTGSSRRFVSEAHEGKPAHWKMCFRAGPAVTGAARAFAAEWLAELP